MQYVFDEVISVWKKIFGAFAKVLNGAFTGSLSLFFYIHIIDIFVYWVIF